MPRLRSWVPLFIVAIVLAIVTAGMRPAVVSAQKLGTPVPTATEEPTPSVSPADAATFAAIINAQPRPAPISGPYSANLVEVSGNIAFSWANVSLESFHAHAVFDVPETTSDTPWDIGFIFWNAPEGSLRIVADSLGSVWFSVGATTPAQVAVANGVSTAAGAANTLDLLVAGGRAFLGVNGTLAATVDLPADATAGDVAAGSGFFTDQTAPNRVTLFSDFVILPLDPNALSPAAGTPEPGDAAQFASRLAQLSTLTPEAGPFAGRLVEATTGTVPQAPAGVSLADFAAAATFGNPANPGQGTWDSGFQFRGNDTERNRIVIDSLGDVYTSLAGQDGQKVGHADSYDASPGASNTLQLFVSGDKALFGVNGDFVATIALPAAPISGDVLIGAGFYNEDFVVGRVTDYKDFQVWPIT